MESNSVEAILIPGGGVRVNGELPLWTRRRLDYAIAAAQDAYLVTLSAGTTHKPPPLDAEGYPIFESVAAAHYLLQHGISPEKILVETSSYDTIGNVYFSRMIHIEPLSLKRLLVVTSEFHMPRTRAIFEWLYDLDGLPQGHDLEFQTVSDEGIDAELLAARRSRESHSLKTVRSLACRLKTVQQFHAWLFQDHSAYAISQKAVRASGNVLKTY
ncbi:MAG: YdcF family protein [Cyanobacteria bacterium P01_D01_bin.56]